MPEYGISTQTSWRERVQMALDGMLYISESEAPLTLLDTASVADLEHVRKFIAVDAGAELEMEEAISSKQFLNQIHWAADPSDPIIQEYALKFDKLFDILMEGNVLVHVIRIDEPKHLIYITAIRSEESVVIRTEAVET
jgi:hypothetical protein